MTFDQNLCQVSLNITKTRKNIWKIKKITVAKKQGLSDKDVIKTLPIDIIHFSPGI